MQTIPEYIEHVELGIFQRRQIFEKVVSHIQALQLGASAQVRQPLQAVPFQIQHLKGRWQWSEGRKQVIVRINLLQVFTRVEHPKLGQIVTLHGQRSWISQGRQAWDPLQLVVIDCKMPQLEVLIDASTLLETLIATPGPSLVDQTAA